MCFPVIKVPFFYLFHSTPVPVLMNSILADIFSCPTDDIKKLKMKNIANDALSKIHSVDINSLYPSSAMANQKRPRFEGFAGKTIVL